jgi:hypothetical protein
MKVFQIPPVVAVLFFSAFCLAALSLLVVLPVALIQWFWNNLLVVHSTLPPIAVWQAGLLYVAGATLMYILGFVRIEFEAQKID